MTQAPPAAPRLGVVGATGIGVGSMLGAGVFVVWGPAAAAAGSWLVAAVGLAAVVAAINAITTAHLAARHPVAGGAYTYGRRELGGTWGFVAGSGFVMGKIASVAAMALAIGAYAWPDHSREVAALVIVAAWALNARGVTRTAGVTTAIAAIVVIALLVFAAVSLGSPAAVQAPVLPDVSAGGVAEAAALLFFAFAGYARLATLGEEVRDPARTIPRAITAALAGVVALYALIAVVLLRRPGVEGLVAARAPWVAALPDAYGWRFAVAAVAVLAAGGAMVALTAGIGRTVMAMAREGDLPAGLARTGENGVPALAEAVAAAASIAMVWWGNLSFALAMSSVAVLTYYGVANAAGFAARGRPGGFPIPRPVTAVGVALCVTLAASLDVAPTLVALGVAAVAVALRALITRRGARRTESQEAPGR